MHNPGRRSTDRGAPQIRLRDEYHQPPSDQEAGQTVFPVFADPPFLTWQVLHRRHEVFLHIHPSVQPLILLWDEVDDSEMLF